MWPYLWCLLALLFPPKEIPLELMDNYKTVVKSLGLWHPWGEYLDRGDAFLIHVRMFDRIGMPVLPPASDSVKFTNPHVEEQLLCFEFIQVMERRLAMFGGSAAEREYLEPLLEATRERWELWRDVMQIAVGSVSEMSTRICLKRIKIRLGPDLYRMGIVPHALPVELFVRRDW